MCSLLFLKNQKPKRFTQLVIRIKVLTNPPPQRIIFLKIVLSSNNPFLKRTLYGTYHVINGSERNILQCIRSNGKIFHPTVISYSPNFLIPEISEKFPTPTPVLFERGPSSGLS